MSKRLFAALFALVMLLSGCTLAKPEKTADDATITDELVGMFITTEYIDSLDIDAWLEENADKLLDGEEVVSPEQPRIYAELVDGSYVFKGLDGLFFAEYTIGSGDTSYRSLDSSEYILDLQTALKTMENETTLKLTGSIFLCNSAESTVFYCNPIYQTADGRVYLIPGDGLQTSPGRATYTLSSATTENSNGQTLTHSSTIEVVIDCVEIAQKVVFVEMNANNTEIGRTEFIPGQMPDEFAAKEDTAYLIIEEHRADGISRSIHQRGDDRIAAFYSQDGRLCLKDYTTAKWHNS